MNRKLTVVFRTLLTNLSQYEYFSQNISKSLHPPPPPKHMLLASAKKGTIPKIQWDQINSENNANACNVLSNCFELYKCFRKKTQL